MAVFELRRRTIFVISGARSKIMIALYREQIFAKDADVLDYDYFLKFDNVTKVNLN